LEIARNKESRRVRNAAGAVRGEQRSRLFEADSILQVPFRHDRFPVRHGRVSGYEISADTDQGIRRDWSGGRTGAGESGCLEFFAADVTGFDETALWVYFFAFRFCLRVGNLLARNDKSAVRSICRPRSVSFQLWHEKKLAERLREAGLDDVDFPSVELGEWPTIYTGTETDKTRVAARTTPRRR